MPERVKGIQRKATTAAEVRSPGRRGPGAVAEGGASATVEMPAAAATGAERVKLFHYLQRTQGNAQVAQMVARLRPPAIRPAVALQRQATACPAPPKEPVSTPPDQDPKFTSVESKIKQQGKDLKKHPTAKSKAKEAQAAAEPPSNDRESQAKAAQAEEMGTAQPAPFNKKAFIEAVRKAIDAASPKTLDEADQFASSGKAGQVKNQVMDKVAKGKEDSAKDVKAKSEQAPDPSKATPKPVTPMAEEKPGAAPADPGAAKAMPGPAPAEQTNLDCGACETNAKMAEAGVTEEHLKKSNEPQMQQAVEAKKAGEEHSARAPAEVRSQEQQQLESARQGATSQTSSSLNTMHQQRRGILGRVGGDKSSTKARDEAKRAEVSTHIEGIYNTTKREVDGILNGLDDKVSSAFTTGESRARRMFEDNHKTEMAQWKDRRYSGVDGAMRWLADKFSPPGDEEAKIFREARNLYLQEMDTVISDVADVVGQELTKAKKRIQQGRDEIRKYVGTLSPELRKVGEEAQQAIASKFDDLDQDVNSKQDSLVNDLAQKYVEARKSVDDKIKQMQEENKGLWDMATEAVGEALEAIEKLKDLFMTTLARAASAFTKILEDPVAFIGNFMNAVKSGFMAFASNILEHLKKGLLGWLFGALASAGIEIPSSFDLKSILKMVASILGLTWGAIKARLVRLIPWLGPVIDFVEDKIEVVAAFVKDGLAGVWNWIKERLTDLKEMILTPIKEFVVESIVKAGITWIIGLLNPAGALAKVVQALIGVVQWVMERGAALGQLIRAVVDAVHDIAHGGMGGVPAKIESALGNAVPLVISFLAGLLGLGGISDKIKQIIQAVQRPIGQAIDTVIGGAIKAGKALFSRLRGRRAEAGGDVKDRAKGMVAERTGTKLTDETALRSVLREIEAALRPEGLKSLRLIPSREKPGSFDVLAAASPETLTNSGIEVNESEETPTIGMKFTVLFEGQWRSALVDAIRENLVMMRFTFKKRMGRHAATSISVPMADVRSAMKGTATEKIKPAAGGDHESDWVIQIGPNQYEVLPELYAEGERTWRRRLYGDFSDALKMFASQRLEQLRSGKGMRSEWSSLPPDLLSRSYVCPSCNKLVDPETSTGVFTLDHTLPVSAHWSSSGKSMTQNARKAWYNDASNLEPMCKRCNGAKGGPDFVPNVELTFRGPGED